MTKGVVVMLVCTKKDSIVAILFSLYTNMAVITSLQTKNYLYNITGKGHGSFAQKRVFFLSPVYLHGRYSLMGNNGAIG